MSRRSLHILKIFAICFAISIVIYIIGGIGTILILGSAALSAQNGTSKNLKTLLDLGVPPNSMSWQTMTAMGFATLGRQRGTMKLLAAKGADLGEPVRIAAGRGDLEMLDFLGSIHPLAALKSKYYTNDRVIDRALLRAAEQVDAKTCAYLIRIGADPNFRDSETGDTPLTAILKSAEYYPQKDKNDTVKVLVAAGADTRTMKSKQMK